MCRRLDPYEEAGGFGSSAAGAARVGAGGRASSDGYGAQRSAYASAIEQSEREIQDTVRGREREGAGMNVERGGGRSRGSLGRRRGRGG